MARADHGKIGFVSNSFEIGPVQVGAGRLFLIAGPCVIESEAHVRSMAEALQRITATSVFRSSSRPATTRRTAPA